ncbi:Trp biosynthesis-associated membrane protein [Pseudonocardia humida]|uniref:Trp biosynthesis-associated membrane protein n=1 Tax=Pseudonocardia humida TaxID=2800819 RepID=A0ABT0ZZ66_9PSEU|nr:Trp biosynthesis-associated membrane protein [Pseudonocardia humida]MCO1655949.1 Trp biosynthesis-associated membrane protein [Pseudonocardia humida]
MTAPPSPRALVAVCAALALAAAALAGSSALTWAEVSPPGRAAVPLSGGMLAPSLTGMALLALGGIASAVAMSGLLRRILGVLLVGAAVVVGLAVVPVLVGDPVAAAGGASLPGGAPVADLAGLPVTATPAPALAAAGALLLVGVGIFILLREPRLPRFGARYATGGRADPARDPDRRAWDDLDEGRDPTTGGGPAGRTGRVDDP